MSPQLQRVQKVGVPLNKLPRPKINLGIGVGLRSYHYDEITSLNPAVDWFEIISENFIDAGREANVRLEKILARYPVVQHGVALSIGSADPLDFDYLKKLKNLARKTKTPWLSDHLSWGRVQGSHFHDLLPLPRTRQVVQYVAERARIVQDFLEVPFALENVSSYVAFTEDEMPEWEFYAAVVELADIYMMLDVNNIYVSSRNHQFNPQDYYSNLPLERVIQIHLAGHIDEGPYCLDTHSRPVTDEVWQLYGEVIRLVGPTSTLLEWDDDFISFQDTWKEALRAKEFFHAISC
jgi:uncharacterized protein